MRPRFTSLCHAVLAAFILLQCPVAAAAEGDNVVVLAPLTKATASIRDLREACQGPGRYDACTRIVAVRLEAHCSVDGGAWTLDASATFRPFIFLHNIQRLTHEKEHIEDIRRSAERFVNGLESIRFESQGQCEARSLVEGAAFASQMGGFALESNLTRHPQLRLIARK